MNHTLHGTVVNPELLAMHGEATQRLGRIHLAAATPLLEAEASTGRKKYWQAFVVTTEDGRAFTRTVSFNETASGTLSKPLVSALKEVKGKNVGRSNETTPAEQAASEIESAAQAKRDKKRYHELGAAKAAAAQRPLPMLAHDFEKRGHNIEFPCFAQPKLDGARMLFDGTVGWSRGGKDFIPEVIAHLRCELPKGVILDGELMLPQGEYTFQDTMRHIKKYRGDAAPKLEYHVYDLVVTDEPDMPFVDRWSLLQDFLLGSDAVAFEPLEGEHLKLTSTDYVQDETEARAMHDEYVQQGYEGLMLRNASGAYKPKHRSPDLQKMKAFDEEEFQVVDFTEGSGKDKGTVVFVCAALPVETFPRGEEASVPTFSVRPRGTDAHRRELFERGDELIGRLLTVRFQGRSEDHVPRFPVGIGIRETELQG